ncbi:MAG TPA: hypothetical protein VGB49_01655 [Caulobacteraceae bacterium]
MARPKQSPEFEIEVDGEPYVWRLQRLPQWSSDVKAFRGKVIAVRHKEGKREATLEFPPEPQPKYGAPLLRVEQIDPQIVATGIAAAIEAGWEPMSRGKTVAIMVDENGG